MKEAHVFQAEQKEVCWLKVIKRLYGQKTCISYPEMWIFFAGFHLHHSIDRLL